MSFRKFLWTYAFVKHLIQGFVECIFEVIDQLENVLW